ncbi:hypothetical protein [Natranaerofaba carboxydovora]|uniref:hypothetical protein n=1 Tax=Natranaerofaba carboxydovora TaxID=2742683 RepID=UPI001F1370DF|nr:hypothetical protein [Natranaerofaba carboxydovora]UMZ73306.1 hypothetical protein ACONDI_00859 [Natranaerofaba carboxydovora]
MLVRLLLSWHMIIWKLVGILLAVGGIVLINEVIPKEFWYVLAGCMMIFGGWILFRSC